MMPFSGFKYLSLFGGTSLFTSTCAPIALFGPNFTPGMIEEFMPVSIEHNGRTFYVDPKEIINALYMTVRCPSCGVGHEPGDCYKEKH